MNFLELAQRARRRCRVTGTGPDAVTGQNEEYARLIDFVNEAWMTIQRKHPDWNWMRASMTFPVVAGQAQYTLAEIESTGTGFTNFGNWTKDSFRNYPTSEGTAQEMFMEEIAYAAWRDRYQFSTNRTTQTRPTEIAQTPTRGLALGGTPAAGYTILGDYFKKPTELVDDTDEPGLDEQHHMVIVYGVMMLYGAGEVAPEVYDMGKIGYDQIMTVLERERLPDIEMAGPLA